MHHEFRWNWNPTVDSLVLSHLLARISTDTNSKEIKHLSLANNAEPPLYRTVQSLVFSTHFNPNRPHQQPCAETLIVEGGYALYWQSSNPSKQRHLKHSCHIYTTVEPERKVPVKVILIPHICCRTDQKKSEWYLRK